MTLGQGPVLSVWPSFRAHLGDVRLTEWRDGEGPAVRSRPSRWNSTFSAWAALRGEVCFSRIHLVRPLFRLAEGDELLQPESVPSGGRLMRAIEMSRSNGRQRRRAPAESSMPDMALGTIEFSEGRVAVRENGRDEALVTGLSGLVYWPLDQPQCSGQMRSGIWRGENFTFEAASAQPLLLFSGVEAPLRSASTRRRQRFPSRDRRSFPDSPI